MKYLVGIDLGTTGLKAGIFQPDGQLVGLGYAANRYLPGPTGRAEQDPRAWWTGCCAAIQDALSTSGVAPQAIAGLSLCGFHHCPVFLDDAGEPARPTIVTHDRRLKASLEDLTQRGVTDEITRTSGSAVTTGHFPPIYHYLAQHEPQTLADTRWIMLAKDYLRFKLTGKVGTEICDATGTHLIAMPEQHWSEALCALLNVPPDKLPPIHRPAEIAGKLTEKAAQATGLAPGTPAAFGGGDSHCALLGLGVIGSAEVGMLLGTNSTLRASFHGFVKAIVPQVWKQQHVAPDRFTVSSSSMAGSSALAWFKDMFCQESAGQPEAEVYQELEARAAEIAPGSDGLLFHPYLYGERAPFYNPNARGGFLAIAYWHTKGHFVRSVLEGVAFCTANCFEVVREIARERGEDIRVVRIGAGGGGRSTLWRQVIAEMLGLPIEVVQAEEPGCLGAALLAGVGVGLYRDLPDAVAQAVHRDVQIGPDSANAALYHEKRRLFNQTFQALEPLLYKS
jgi:xylulokinase